MNSVLEFTSYTSPNGTRMANPILVERQLQEMRIVMNRMRRTQIVEESTMSHLHQLANRINGVGRKVTLAKRKMRSLRAVSKRMQAVHETSDPVITQKLNKIHPES